MEIETKIIGMDAKLFKKQLDNLNAQRIYFGENTTIFFDNGTLGTDMSLRLRNFNNKKVELTYKGPKEESKYKVRDEINLLIDDFNASRRLLNNIGFKEIEMLKNKRESYELFLGKIGYHIDIDYYDGLDPFIEIEAKTEKDLEYALKYFNIEKDMIFNGTIYDLRKISPIKRKNL